MRVSENDTDRKAEVHLHKEGKVPPLAEYGEYIDEKDGAICCYVPLTEDDKVKIRTNFQGTVNTSWSYHMKLREADQSNDRH